MIRKVAPGVYTYGNLILRAIRKFEQIIREELDKRGCQEILMPMVQPASLWQETGRWTEMGEGLLKFKNRNQHDFALGATHEEVVTDYVRKDVKSYRDLPITLYQIQTKYRDELRPRFGLMRGREFIMKDAYSFDVDSAGALKNYELLYGAYKAIFERLGLQFRIVQADAGNIGGSQTHEFQVLADAGEDQLMVCDKTEFAANVEICPALDAEPVHSSELEKPLESFATPGLKSIGSLSKALQIPEKELVKTLFFSANDGSDPKNKELKPIAVLLRGSDELNPIKLKNILSLANPPLMLSDEEVKQVSGAWPGSCGPVGLKIPIYMDQGVAGLKNMIVGANQDAVHLKNVNSERDFKPTHIADLRMARAGDRSPAHPEGRLQAFRGIEVGHVFYLGTKYSQMMGAQFLTQEGENKPIEMGCYGIGVSRTVQAAIEQSHDKDGMIWPMAITPFHVHICVLDPDNSEILQAAEIFYRDLGARGWHCFMDDRMERPGVKFKDADLLGFPLRLNIGSRGLKNNEVEIVVRKTRETFKVAPEQVVEKAVAWLREAQGV
jgi:prolyl-tRNA synthetase